MPKEFKSDIIGKIKILNRLSITIIYIDKT